MNSLVQQWINGFRKEIFFLRKVAFLLPLCNVHETSNMIFLHVEREVSYED